MSSEGCAAPHPMAGAYQAAESARLALAGLKEPDLRRASGALGEAAYYLSDTIEPDDRVALLSAVESQVARSAGSEQPVGDALDLLGSADEQVRRLLARPLATGELRLALRAIAQARELLTRPRVRRPTPQRPTLAR